MADPLTHLCVGLLLSAALRGRLAAPLAWGAVLPDLASRGPSEALEGLLRLGVRLPDAAYTPWTVLHTPALGLVIGAATAALFVIEERRSVFFAVAAGVASHFALDVIQDHQGVGYALGYPLTLIDVEIGWIGSEATVAVAWPLAGFTAAIWLWRPWAAGAPAT